MRDIEILCTQIKQNPKCIVDIDWADETDNFDVTRMHELVLALNDLKLINSVNALIVSEWELLESQNDPRCFIILENGEEQLKFPDRTDYSDGPHYNSWPNVSIRSITGVLYLCKEEAKRKLVPIINHKKIREELTEKYSHPSGTTPVIHEDGSIKEPFKLVFFDNRIYVTAEEQQSLRTVLQSELTNIDSTNGREWFAYYAAYRYVKKLNSSQTNYVGFFSDIEKLLPGALEKLNLEAKGDKRYKHYTMQLSKEVKSWYVDYDKLPPINRLIYEDYHFLCSSEKFEKLAVVIRRLFNRINNLENKIKEEKGVQ